MGNSHHTSVVNMVFVTLFGAFVYGSHVLVNHLAQRASMELHFAARVCAKAIYFPMLLSNFMCVSLPAHLTAFVALIEISLVAIELFTIVPNVVVCAFVIAVYILLTITGAPLEAPAYRTDT